MTLQEFGSYVTSEETQTGKRGYKGMGLFGSYVTSEETQT